MSRTQAKSFSSLISTLFPTFSKLPKSSLPTPDSHPLAYVFAILFGVPLICGSVALTLGPVLAPYWGIDGPILLMMQIGGLSVLRFSLLKLAYNSAERDDSTFRRGSTKLRRFAVSVLVVFAFACFAHVTGVTLGIELKNEIQRTYNLSTDVNGSIATLHCFGVFCCIIVYHAPIISRPLRNVLERTWKRSTELTKAAVKAVAIFVIRPSRRILVLLWAEESNSISETSGIEFHRIGA